MRSGEQCQCGAGVYRVYATVPMGLHSRKRYLRCSLFPRCDCRSCEVVAIDDLGRSLLRHVPTTSPSSQSVEQFLGEG